MSVQVLSLIVVLVRHKIMVGTRGHVTGIWWQTPGRGSKPPEAESYWAYGSKWDDKFANLSCYSKAGQGTSSNEICFLVVIPVWASHTVYGPLYDFCTDQGQCKLHPVRTIPCELLLISRHEWVQEAAELAWLGTQQSSNLLNIIQGCFNCHACKWVC